MQRVLADTGPSPHGFSFSYAELIISKASATTAALELHPKEFSDFCHALIGTSFGIKAVHNCFAYILFHQINI